MASLFRTARPTAPPTSFPRGLQPAGADDQSTRANRRASRTEQDFEDALAGEGTVKLREGIDVSRLGLEALSSPARSVDSPLNLTATPQQQHRSRSPALPQTPTIIPPTPVPGPSKATHLADLSPSPIPSARDVFDDPERHISRRSMYRSPGTASSPDLATLLRKAKEKGNAASIPFLKEKRQESPPPPLPSDRSGGRKRSSTSFNASAPSSPPVTALFKGKNKYSTGLGASDNSDWVLASPSPNENGTIKVCSFYPPTVYHIDSFPLL